MKWLRVSNTPSSAERGAGTPEVLPSIGRSRRPSHDVSALIEIDVYGFPSVNLDLLTPELKGDAGPIPGVQHLRPQPSPAVFINLSGIELGKAAEILTSRSRFRSFNNQLSYERALLSPCYGEIVDAVRNGSPK